MNQFDHGVESPDQDLRGPEFALPSSPQENLQTASQDVLGDLSGKKLRCPGNMHAPHAQPPAQAKEYYARTEAQVPEICPSKPSKHLNKTA
jgi:hypothetical protein